MSANISDVKGVRTRGGNKRVEPVTPASQYCASKDKANKTRKAAPGKKPAQTGRATKKTATMSTVRPTKKSPRKRAATLKAKAPKRNAKRK